MSKRFLLSVVAVGFIASTAVAGTTAKTSDVNVSGEWLQQQYIKNSGVVDINVSGGFVYTPESIPLTSMKNPVLNVKIQNVKDLKLNLNSGTLFVCQMNYNKTTKTYSVVPNSTPILKYQSSNGVDGYTLTAFTADTYMTNGEHYGLFYDTNTSDNNCSSTTMQQVADYNGSGTTQPNLFTVQPSNDTVTNITETLTLGTGDTQEVKDSAPAFSQASIMPQVCASVVGFGKKIDPTTGFVAFAPLTEACGATNIAALQDTVQLTYKAVNSINAPYQLKTADVYNTITSNVAIPLAKVYDNGVDVTDNSNVFKRDGNTYEFIEKNYAFPTVKDNNVTNTYNFQLNGKDQIKPVDFTITSKIDLNQDGTPDLTKLNNFSAGQWVYNGTTLNIPYVVSSGDTRTAIRIDNTSNVNADVYWTCYDDQGNEVSNIQVPTANDANMTGIVSGGASAWLAKDILAKAQTVNPDFASDGKMTCAPLVTATQGVNGVAIMTINGARDRVIPINK